MHRRPAVSSPPASPLIVHCPYCQALLSNDGSLAGRLAYCPGCLNPFQMPGESSLPVARAATADSLARSVPTVIRQPLGGLPGNLSSERPGTERPPLPAVPRIAWREVDEQPRKVPSTRPASPPPGTSPQTPTPNTPRVETPTSTADTPPALTADNPPPGLLAPVVEAPRVQPALPAAAQPVSRAPAPQQALPPAAPPRATSPADPTRIAPQGAPAWEQPDSAAPARVETLASPVQPALPWVAPLIGPPVARIGAPPVEPAIDPLSFLPPLAFDGPPPAVETGEAPTEEPCLAGTPFFEDLSVSGACTSSEGPPAPFPVLDAATAPIDYVPGDLEDEVPAEEDPENGDWRQHTPAFVTSAVTHGVLLIALAMWIIVRETAPPLALLADWSATNQASFEPTPFEVKIEAPETVDASQMTQSAAEEPAPFQAAAELAIDAPAAVEDVRMANIPPTLPGTAKMSGFDGRGEAQRAARLLREGGSPESESAVAAGLKWLKEHQYPDGSWRFDHTGCPGCDGACENPGWHESTTGATALALLPFLGAGQTHTQGKYQETVRRGLYYLVKKQEGKGAEAGDLRGEDGDMYCHGLAATALCEAYGMSRDKMLLSPAQKSLDFIVYAQDPRGGGWRYQPRTRGDTSIVGWQIMAMKSGHMAYLKVPRATITKANAFLESVSAESGSTFGYMQPRGGTPATTAIGLLCRMHMGYSREHPGIVRGVQYLAEEGPSRSNMYYNYYATQVLRQYGGPQWTRWNEVMRDWLINGQSRAGHETGSWAGRDTHREEGGRLYVTALSIMTLEVYYRHMPLYKEDAVKNDFKP